jgi:hypothetical protein
MPTEITPRPKRLVIAIAIGVGGILLSYFWQQSADPGELTPFSASKPQLRVRFDHQGQPEGLSTLENRFHGDQ